MLPKRKIHFEISERKILLRIFDVIVVLLVLNMMSQYLDFDYFSISRENFYWPIVLGIYIIIFGTVFEMYNLQVASNQFQVIRSIVLTSSTTCLFYMLTPFFSPFLPLNRLQIIYFFCGVFFGLLFWRIFYQRYLGSYRFEKKVILVCEQDQLNKLVSDIENIDPHYKIIGYINTATHQDGSKQFRNIMRLTAEDTDVFIRKNYVSEIVIASQKMHTITVPLYNTLLGLLQFGITIREYSHVYEYLTQRIPIHRFDKDFYEYFPFSRNNQNELYLLIVKVNEYFFAFIGLLGCGIIIPFIFIGNLIGNKGTLFYTQERIGKNGVVFKIYKFRTMIKNAEKDQAVFSNANDTRVTPFGKFLRKTRIDETPQFINILKGDMGFIGPRPERPYFVNQITSEMPFYNVRHVMKPGLTGWAQVNYSYGESIEDSLIKLQYDLYYIKHRGIFIDINVILRTLSTVLFYRGQ